MQLVTRYRRYVAHDDDLTGSANVIAMIIAGNGPIYPIYVLGICGLSGWPSLLIMISTPFFFAIPWLSHRSPRLARAALPLIGIANTLWSIELLGVNSGVALFLLPCITLAVMLFRRNELFLSLPILGIAMSAYLWGPTVVHGPMAQFTSSDLAHLVSLHEVSVATLTACLGFIFASKRIDK